MEKLVRSFIALQIPLEIQKALVNVVETAQLNPANGFRPVRNGMIHITLKFLGDTPEKKIPQIKEELTRIAEFQNPFPLTVQRIGAFASWDHPRTIWAGLDFPPELSNLVDQTSQMTEQLGFPGDHRQFSPHLTLARVTQGADFTRVKHSIEILRKNSNLVFGKIIVSQIVLFESELQRGGSIYTPISRHSFGGKKV